MAASVVRKQLSTSPAVSVREQLKLTDDSGVVTAFLGGEERAFEELVVRYQTRLLNFIYRTVGDRERAEDLVQEVFIRVYRHLHRFDRSKKFSTWVYTIASNLAKNELRNRSRNPLVLFQSIRKEWEPEARREVMRERRLTGPRGAIEQRQPPRLHLGRLQIGGMVQFHHPLVHRVGDGGRQNRFVDVFRPQDLRVAGEPLERALEAVPVDGRRDGHQAAS